MCGLLDQVESGKLKRLILTVPPQHSKSFHVSELFPCYYLGKNPLKYVVQTGYSADLAIRHSRHARDIFASDRFHEVFPNVHHRPATEGQKNIQVAKQTVHEWGTVQGGSYFAVGVGGGLTGNPMDLGIIDDPFKDLQEAMSKTIRENVWGWYGSVFRTRMAEDAGLILIMTRWNVDDIVGRIENLMKDDPTSDRWKIINLPAIALEDDPLGRTPGEALWPENKSIDFLISQRSEIGSKMFESLYQGNPTIATGEVIKREWWNYYNEFPNFEQIIQSWDCAFKKGSENDYSVCTTWGLTRNSAYLIDTWRDKVTFPELTRVFLNLYNKYLPRVVLVEDKASGQSLIQEIEAKTRIPLVKIIPETDKLSRVNSITPMIEAGKVLIPNYAPWLHDFIEECCEFPNSTHDDQVDTMSQFLNYIRPIQPRGEEIIVYDSISELSVDLDL